MSKYAGVSYRSKYKRWVARIPVAGVPTYLGSFDTFELALAARLEAEQKYFPDGPKPKVVETMTASETIKSRVLRLLDDSDQGMTAKDVASELQITEALASVALEDLRGQEVYVSNWKPILGKPWQFLPVYDWGYKLDAFMPKPGPCESKTYQTRDEFIEKLKHAKVEGHYRGPSWSDVLGVRL